MRAWIVAPRASACSWERSGALAVHHSVAIGIERSAGSGRIVLAMGQRPTVAVHQRSDVDAGSGSAGEHHVGMSALDHAHRFDDGRETAGFADRQRIIGSAGVEGDGDMAGDHIRQVHQQPQRIELVHAVRAPPFHLKLPVDHRAAKGFRHLLQIAVEHFAAQNDAQPLRIDGPFGQSPVIQGQASGRETGLDFAAHDLQALARRDEFFGLKVLDFAAERHRQLAGVEERHGADAAGACFQGLPVRRFSNTNGADHSGAGDDDLPLLRHVRTI
jgi:hypothetical protein